MTLAVAKLESDSFKGNKRKLIGIYFVLMLLCCVTFVGGIFVLVLQNINQAETEFRQYSHQVHQSLAQSFAVNETILDGFAAFLADVGMQEPNRARFYTRSMMDRYNHLYMFQAAQRVAGDQVQAFEQDMSLHLNEPMLVRSFVYGRGLVPAAQDEAFQYYPIVFVEPTFTDGFSVLGLDIASIQFIKDAMNHARSSGLGAISQPIELSEGEPAFVLVKPVYRKLEAEPGQYALLVVKSDELIPNQRPSEPGFQLRVALTGGEFSFLNIKTEGMSAWESWLFPVLNKQLNITVGAQTLILTLRQQLGFKHLNGSLIGILMVITLVVSLAVALMLRLHLEAELIKQEASVQLYRQANYDNLTGLANRHYFDGNFRRCIAAAKRRQAKLALVYLDLNDFKQINDTLGHQVGDRVLMIASEVIQDVIRADDLASRFGGDEFVIMLESIQAKADVDCVIDRLRERFTQVTQIDGNPVQLKTSAGYALYPDDGGSFDQLVRISDKRMYEDKRASKSAG